MNTTAPAPRGSAPVRSDAALEHDADRAASRVRAQPDGAARAPPPAIAHPTPRHPDLGAGQPLHPATRARYEPRFGASLDHVRVHTDPDAAARAREIRADAYTHGADIVFAADRYAPGTDSGDRLLAHELAHVVQQTTPADAANAAGADPVGIRGAAPAVARSVDQWLAGSVAVNSLSYTQLVAEIDELNQWINRQTATTDDLQRVEEALRLLRAEVNRRDTAAAGPRTPAARRTRGGARAARAPAPAAAASSEPLPDRYPRILTEMTSVMYENPADMRAEYDLIMQWLTRPEISAHERSVLTTERNNLAPQLNVDRGRVVAERHARRVQAALAPPDPAAVDALANLARTIQGIAGEPGNPNLFYLYHQGERVAISAEQAQSLRGTLHDQLSRAGTRVIGNSEYYWERYHAQVALNDEHPVIAGISGWLGDVEDPGAELATRCFVVQGQVGTLRAYVASGNMVEAATLLPTIENNAEAIRQLARAYYEGYIEGAERAVHYLEITRNASFAIAGSIAAVLAAPVVAGFVGAGGLGVTGIMGTGLTVVGTGTLVGTGVGVVRGGSAALGTGLAGGSLDEAAAAFRSEGSTGFREGFMAGAGGAAGRLLGPALGVGSNLGAQALRRIAAEAIVNGTSTLIDVLIQGGTLEQAVQAALRSAVLSAPGALVGGSNNPIARNLVAPFTAGGTAYLGARASGMSPEDAMAQAGVAVAQNIAMSRATHGADADAALVESGRSAGAATRDSLRSTGRTVATYSAAVLIGTADALPPLRSGFGGSSIAALEIDASPRIGSVSASPTTRSAPTPDPMIETTTTPRTTAAPDIETPAAAIGAPRPELETPTAATPAPAPDTSAATDAATPTAGADELAAPAATTVAPPTTPSATEEVAPVTSATRAVTPNPNEAADAEAWGAQITAELGLDAPTTAPRTGSTATRIADAHADATAAGWVDPAGDPAAGSPVRAVVGAHEDASERRGATGQTGRTRESAHIGATSLLRTLLNYSRARALTVLLPRATHQAFDHNWMRWISNRRRAIRAFGSSDFTAPLSDVLDAQRQALRQTPGLSQETRNTLESMMDREFAELAARMPDGMNTRVPLPAVWGS
ncbi:hypothetical protein HDC36_000885 [Xanthomonas sp. JAI131]|uniref:eCIS core domain-containing protein n=1 Tax=Xanthomonas sp. JAI131 TaxID=2723067 RepID=UPI00184E7821|nr:DUF4157 domain-containing protein [Xanthomonas sp. JAI131]NYF19448.1 hypothetical protein [Xanthomonas sp. JAI131]